MHALVHIKLTAERPPFCWGCWRLCDAGSDL